MAKQKGATMVEILVAMSIFVVTFIIMGALFVSHSKLFTLQESISSLKIYKSLFAKHFRETAETSYAVAPSYTFGGTLYTSSNFQVIFQVPSVDASEDLINDTYDYIVFYLNGDELFMETAANPLSERKTIKQKVGENIDSLIFRYNSSIPSAASLVNAYLHLTENSATDQVNVSAYLRNKGN